jgi:hypothetical protein
MGEGSGSRLAEGQKAGKQRRPGWLQTLRE